VKVFPNPYMPGSGGDFDDPIGPPGIVFEFLTSNVRLLVLNLAGEKVHEHEERGGIGAYRWNAKNDRGERVASGVYIYRIENLDDDSDVKRGKLAIIR